MIPWIVEGPIRPWLQKDGLTYASYRTVDRAVKPFWDVFDALEGV
jgi:hypothetical protein